MTAPGVAVAARDEAGGERPEPIARVRGFPFVEVPRDLYIPPDALEVILEAFAGPLDLLLYLIKRQNLDILDIPIADVTRQYMEYVEVMKELKLELAAEYLVMAATLAEIKSRMLLPRPASSAEEEDPRAELVRRLLEYERFRAGAEALDRLPRVGRDLLPVQVEVPDAGRGRPLPPVGLTELLAAMRDLLARAELFAHHHVRREPLSVRERMSRVLARLEGGRFLELAALVDPREGRPGVVVTVLAVLELLKGTLIELVQTEPYGPVHLRAAA